MARCAGLESVAGAAAALARSRGQAEGKWNGLGLVEIGVQFIPGVWPWAEGAIIRGDAGVRGNASGGIGGMFGQRVVFA